MINWRGLPYYLALSALGQQEWRTHFREVSHSDTSVLSEGYLHRLLRHTCEHVPYYQALGLEGKPLREYPVRRKEDIREDPGQYTTDNLSDYHWSKVTTSGSTGETLEVVRDQSTIAWATATDMWYFNKLLGTTRRAYTSAYKAYVWPRNDTPDGPLSPWLRLARFMAPILWLSPHEALSEAGLLAYARAISRARPAYIWSYAGVLYEIARVALDRGVKMPSPRFITSTGETLHPFMRPVIEEAFGCRVYDYYGSSEAGRVAAECREGNLHIFDFACHVEVLDPSGQPTPPGQEGRLILTPLHNYSMPLIRYDSADMAEVGPRECPCGCQLPTLSRISGRAVEFFITSKGRLISGALISKLLRSCAWIMGFQALQQDIDQIEIFFYRAIKSEISQADIERVNSEIGAMLGVNCRIDWHEVAEIPRTPNGKRPYVRSLVWESRLPSSLWESE
jgi:phenylacetate-coenzyme A ligase PaaK-like adenylate-forming protein